MAQWWVKRRLAWWGQWARGGLPHPPTVNILEMMRSGRGGRIECEMPYDIAQVDLAVCQAPKEQKIVLIVRYAQQGQLHEKALRLGISRHQFRHRLEAGESFVAMHLS